jgi:uncharacterized protein (TIGR02466 family)
MNIISLFPVGIAKDVILIDEKYKLQLINEILNHQKKNQQEKTNAAWTGDVNNNEYLHNNKLFSALYEKINQVVIKYIKLIGYKTENINIYFQRSWATISNNSQNIFLHAHLQSHLSFAYYLSFPEGSGKLEFHNDRSFNEIVNGAFDKPELLKSITNNFNAFNAPNASVDVKENEIYIFPSKLKHKTKPGSNQKPRISLSSDIIVTLNENMKSTEMGMADITHWKKF